MRISDWSSDVCPSDLADRADAHRRQISRLFGDDLERPGAARADVLERRAARRHVSREHPRRRSEEHTSELQSLMRISYAVFCLKKKTKITLQILIRLAPL